MLSIPKKVILILLEFTLAFMMMFTLYNTLLPSQLVQGNSYFGFSSVYNMFLDVDRDKFMSLEDIKIFVEGLTVPVNFSSADFSWFDFLAIIFNFLWVPLMYVTGFSLYLFGYVYSFVMVVLKALIGYYNVPIDNQYCMSCDINLIL